MLHSEEKMIAFETAYAKARGRLPEQVKITCILETPEYWVFYDDRCDTMPIGYKPFAVDKKDGRAWLVFYPDHAEEIEAAKELPLPPQ